MEFVGALIAGTDQLFDLDLAVSCVKVNCDISMATDNVKVTVSAEIGEPVAVHELAVVTSDWVSGSQSVMPSLGIGFPYAGHTK